MSMKSTCSSCSMGILPWRIGAHWRMMLPWRQIWQKIHKNPEVTSSGDLFFLCEGIINIEKAIYGSFGFMSITVCRGVRVSMRLAPPSQRASNIPRNQPAKKIFGPSIHHRKRLERAALGRQPFPRDGSAKYFFFTQNANAPFMDALCPGGWAR